jgi:hypothetical protein
MPATIIAHIRSREIVVPPVNRYRLRPSWRYYLKAIEMDEATDVRAVSEEMKIHVG